MPTVLPPLLHQADSFNVVDGGAAKILKRAKQRDGIAGVVKLPVVVEDAATKAVAHQPRQPLQRFSRERISERPNESWPESSSYTLSPKP